MCEFFLRASQELNLTACEYLGQLDSIRQCLDGKDMVIGKEDKNNDNEESGHSASKHKLQK
jgi:hypothetical protein